MMGLYCHNQVLIPTLPLCFVIVNKWLNLFGVFLRSSKSGTCLTGCLRSYAWEPPCRGGLRSAGHSGSCECHVCIPDFYWGWGLHTCVPPTPLLAGPFFLGLSWNSPALVSVFIPAWKVRNQKFWKRFSPCSFSSTAVWTYGAPAVCRT